MSKPTIDTTYSHIYNLKPFCTWICDYKSILPHVTEDGWNNNHENGWSGHKLQTYGLEWIGLFVVLNGSKNLKLIFQRWNNIFYLKILNINYG